MGTRLNPGKFDCAAAALDDEPQFTVLARSPEFATVVMTWAEIRARRIRSGELKIANSTQIVRELQQVTEAFDVAARGAAWRIENDGRWRREQSALPKTPLQAAKDARAQVIAEIRAMVSRARIGEARTEMLRLLDNLAAEVPATLTELTNAFPR